jgi:hypothetical protein
LRGGDRRPVQPVRGDRLQLLSTKEDLIDSRLGDLRADLLEHIRNRDRSRTISAAFREFLLSQRPPGQTPEELEALVTLTGIINESPSLLARAGDQRPQHPRAADPRPGGQAFDALDGGLAAYPGGR